MKESCAKLEKNLQDSKRQHQDSKLRVIKLQAEIDELKSPEHQLALLEDQQKYEQAASKIKMLEDKLKKREAKLKEAERGATAAQEQNRRLIEHANDVAPLKAEVRLKSREIVACKQTIESETQKSEDLQVRPMPKLVSSLPEPDTYLARPDIS